MKAYHSIILGSLLTGVLLTGCGTPNVKSLHSSLDQSSYNILKEGESISTTVDPSSVKASFSFENKTVSYNKGITFVKKKSLGTQTPVYYIKGSTYYFLSQDTKGTYLSALNLSTSKIIFKTYMPQVPTSYVNYSSSIYYGTDHHFHIDLLELDDGKNLYYQFTQEGKVTKLKTYGTALDNYNLPSGYTIKGSTLAKSGKWTLQIDNDLFTDKKNKTDLSAGYLAASHTGMTYYLFYLYDNQNIIKINGKKVASLNNKKNQYALLSIKDDGTLQTKYFDSSYELRLLPYTLNNHPVILDGLLDDGGYWFKAYILDDDLHKMITYTGDFEDAFYALNNDSIGIISINKDKMFYSQIAFSKITISANNKSLSTTAYLFPDIGKAKTN